MDCEFCKEGELEKIEKPKTHDYNREGHPFKLCNLCSTADNMDEREERRMVRAEIKRESRYSFNDKRKVLRKLCHEHEYNGVKKKEIMDEILPEIKWVRDETCYQKICEIFEVSRSHVLLLFCNIVRYKINSKPEKEN